MDQPKKILIADDEAPILLALEFLIKQAGYEVAKASNGLEALKVMESFVPDIAVLDVMMPDLDGFELAKEIRTRSQFNDTTIIFLTAKGTTEDRFRGYETGAEVYLTKPFDNEELIMTINEVMQFT